MHLLVFFIGPDCSMVIQEIGQVIRHKVLAGDSEVNWVPVLKFLTKFTVWKKKKKKILTKTSVIVYGKMNVISNFFGYNLRILDVFVAAFCDIRSYLRR